MILRAVLWAVVVLFPISEIILAVLKRASPGAASVQDRGSMRMLWLAIAAGVATAVASQWVPGTHLLLSSRLLHPLALGLMIVGLAVRWVAILTLGRFFTVDVAVQSDHALVEVGLYRFVRHPSYSGLLLAFIGLGVFFANWLGLLALLLPITLAVLNRIVKEESALRNALGASYQAYCSRTKRLVPGVF